MAEETCFQPNPFEHIDPEDAAAIAQFAGDNTACFYNASGNALNISSTFKDASAFLIAGGPSFASLDAGPLRKVWCMTLNNAVATFRGNASCTVDDPSRFNLSLWLDPLITKFVPAAYLNHQLWDNRRLSSDQGWSQQWKEAKYKVRDCPNVIGYVRNHQFSPANWLTESTVNWGRHSCAGGGRSVLLPALRILYILGFRNVYLLGVDFDMSPTLAYHFNEARSLSTVRGNLNTYARLRTWLAQLQPYFIDAGFSVKNCNPKSRLDAFPFISYEDALMSATTPLGDYSKERTDGMYWSIEDKSPNHGGLGCGEDLNHLGKAT